MNIGTQAVSPRNVLERVASAIPADVRPQIIIIGSLAAAYQLFPPDETFGVRTKDIDCVLSPYVTAVESGCKVTEELLASGWRPLAAGDFGKWWFWGMPFAQTAAWFPYNLPPALGGSDITNQFLIFGLTAGLLAIILFVLLLVKCYKSLGRAMRIVRSAFPKPTETEFLLWGLAVMLTAHIENWFAISYFDQTYVIWFMQLAAIVSISQICLQSYSREQEKRP